MESRQVKEVKNVPLDPLSMPQTLLSSFLYVFGLVPARRKDYPDERYLYVTA
jgi:hypothetical protein